MVYLGGGALGCFEGGFFRRGRDISGGTKWQKTILNRLVPPTYQLFCLQREDFLLVGLFLRWGSILQTDDPIKYPTGPFIYVIAPMDGFTQEFL